MFNDSDFKIVIPVKIREQIQYYVDKADKEISGLGDAIVDNEKKEIIIQSAFLLDQVCTATSTDLEEGAVAKAMFQAHKDEEDGKPRSVKFWWHSHVNMNVFWSGTDKDTMKELSEHGWFCHIVFNKKREMLGGLSYPMYAKIGDVNWRSIKIHEKVAVQVGMPVAFSKQEIESFDKEMKDKYKEKTYTSTYVSTYRGNKVRSIQQDVQYFKKRFGATFEHAHRANVFEVGDKTPLGETVLYWGGYLKVVELPEPDATKPPVVLIQTTKQDTFVNVMDKPQVLDADVLLQLNYDSLHAIMEALEYLPANKYKKKKKQVKEAFLKKFQDKKGNSNILSGILPGLPQ